MTRIRLLGLAASAAATLLGAGAAAAGPSPVFDHITLTPTGIPPVIIVESQDGKKWSKIRPQKLLLSGKVDVAMDKGRLSGYSLAHSGVKLIDKSIPNQPKSIKTEISFQSHTNNLAIASITAVATCNGKLASGKGIHQDHLVGITSDVTLIGRARDDGLSEIKREGYGSFPITVKCLGVPEAGPQAGADDLAGAFAVKSAALGIHKPQSNACPTTASINARFETNMKGKVTFIYRRAGGGKSNPITVNAKKMPNGKFMAVHNQEVKIDKATDTKYMVEVVGKGIISDWQSLKVPCKIQTGGNGGLAPTPEVPMKALSAQIGIKGPKTKLCPATATLMAWIKTNKPGKIGFRLMRKDGPVGPMIFATAVKSGNGYMATYTRKIEIAGPVSQSYSVVVPGSGGVASNFAPLKASCSIKQPGELKKGS